MASQDDSGKTEMATVGTKVSEPIKKELEARSIDQSEPGDRRNPSDILRELIHAYLGVDPNSMHIEEEDIEAVREETGNDGEPAEASG